MRKTLISAALVAVLASPAIAQDAGPGGASGGGGGGDSGSTSLCPFPVMPTIAVRSPDFCLMNEAVPVLVKQIDPSWKDQGLIPLFRKGAKGDIIGVE